MGGDSAPRRPLVCGWLASHSSHVKSYHWPPFFALSLDWNKKSTIKPSAPSHQLSHGLTFQKGCAWNIHVITADRSLLPVPDYTYGCLNFHPSSDYMNFPIPASTFPYVFLYVNFFMFNEIMVIKEKTSLEGVIAESSITFWFELTFPNPLEYVTLKVLVEGFSLLAFRSLHSRTQSAFVGNSPPVPHLWVHVYHCISCIQRSIWCRVLEESVDEWTSTMAGSVPDPEVPMPAINRQSFKLIYFKDIINSIFIGVGGGEWEGKADLFQLGSFLFHLKVLFSHFSSGGNRTTYILLLCVRSKQGPYFQSIPEMLHSTSESGAHAISPA